MENTTYNGWTNYATWRINLEWFDGFYHDHIDSEGKCEGGWLQQYVVDGLEQSCDNEATLSYALAFINDVDWYEIAKNINDSIESV